MVIGLQVWDGGRQLFTCSHLYFLNKTNVQPLCYPITSPLLSHVCCLYTKQERFCICILSDINTTVKFRCPLFAVCLYSWFAHISSIVAYRYRKSISYYFELLVSGILFSHFALYVNRFLVCWLVEPIGLGIFQQYVPMFPDCMSCMPTQPPSMCSQVKFTITVP